MRAWVGYAGIALAVAVLGSVGAALIAPGPVANGVTFSGALAWVLQVTAFAVLLKVRNSPTAFMIGWLGGIVMRFAAVGVVAFWLTRTRVFPPSPTLVSLVAFVFVLLLLEPLFLRKGQSTR